MIPPRCFKTGLLAFALAFVFASASISNAATCSVWRVTNAKAPFYLVGSVHALSPKDYPLPAPYETALRDSKRLLFEFNPNQGDEFDRKFEAAGKYPPGQDIRRHIDPRALAWLRQNTEAINFNYNPKEKKYDVTLKKFDSSLQYKPWWIAQHYFDIRSFSDVTSKKGVDNYLANRARKMGKELGGLESVDEHVAVLGGLNDMDSQLLLLDTLVYSHLSDAEFDGVRSAWRRGDMAKLWDTDARLRKEAFWIAARLLEQRNIQWIPRIERELKSGKPTAIVAGALHFAGANGVVALLEKRGYKIEQL
jgi:uncharacterized protein YbaP (TraB family)